MKNTTFIFGIVIALVIGGGIGYLSGKGVNNDGAKAKELQDSIAMMKEQSTKILRMGELMKSGGIMMQELGMKYGDDEAVATGKDLEMVGEKYIQEDAKASEGTSSMKKTME